MGCNCCKRLLGVGNDPRETTLLETAQPWWISGDASATLRQRNIELIRSDRSNDHTQSGQVAAKQPDPPLASRILHQGSNSTCSTTTSSTKGVVFEMTFAQPPPGSPFASSYEANPSDKFAFLIPGDEELFVGGGALNGAVGKLLMKEAGQNISYEMTASGEHVLEMDPAVGREVPKYNKKDCVYRRLHEILFEKARLSVGKLVVAAAEDIGEAPVSFAGAKVYSDDEWPFGAVFVNIFKEEKRPFGAANNVALLYTVGALGRNNRAEGEGAAESFREARVYSNPQDFVHAIYLTGQNIMETVAEFNQRHAGREPTRPSHINTVRLPIVSGGTFIHPEVTATQVALALIWGVSSALSTADVSARPRVELMPGADMQEAYRMYYEEKAQPIQWNTEEKKFLYSEIANSLT